MNHSTQLQTNIHGSSMDTTQSILTAELAEGKLYKRYSEELCLPIGILKEALGQLIGTSDISATVYRTPLGVFKINAIYGSDKESLLNVECVATYSAVQFLDALFAKYPAVKKNEPGVYSVNIDHFYLDKTESAKGEMKVNEHYKLTTDFEHLIPEMYPKIDITEMMKQYSDSDESLMILSGKPGTGKTCVAKMMMAAHAKNLESDIYVVYVKDQEILSMDHFWARLANSEPHLLILDDLDNELKPRGKEGNQIVSNMLSYSDGIFDVRTKILITTNLTDSLIDRALVRPGRAFDALCLPQLDRAEAIEIWTNHLKAPVEEFESRFVDMPIIMQAALMSEFQRFSKEGAASYLKDKSISIRKLVEESEVISQDE